MCVLGGGLYSFLLCVTLRVYQVKNGSDRNFNEIVIVLYIDLLLFHKKSV
jgi:hypothetical protein